MSRKFNLILHRLISDDTHRCPRLQAKGYDRRNVLLQPIARPRLPRAHRNIAAAFILLVALLTTAANSYAKPGEGSYRQHYTLARFARLMEGKAGAMLPTVLPRDYHLTDIYGFDSVEQYQQADGTWASQVIPLRTWAVYYYKQVTPFYRLGNLSIDVDPQAQITYQDDHNNTVPKGLDAVGAPGMNYNYSGPWADASRLTVRYRRADRVIELYQGADQTPGQYAVIYFANHDRNITLTRFFVQAGSDISSDDLIRLADSIRPIDTDALDRYQ
ncbi:MAG: hypothetical protein DLM69_06450 [Candidatus Chloroheliales bacterium]|nr:MAG: hypothetical protein DLM69_06450 [Chloroflexota bacterium]